MVLLGLFILGFLTWGLVVLRGFALERKSALLLGGLIFVDECLGVGTCVWIVQNGNWYSVLAIASGGACAAVVVTGLWGRKG